jgi:hypothetical protein
VKLQMTCPLEERNGRSRAWALWWCGVFLIPVSGAVMLLDRGHCTGFWPTDVVTHHRCVDTSASMVWLMWLVAFACMTVAMFRLERAGLRSVLFAQLIAGIVFCVTPTMPTADAYQYHLYGEISQRWNPWQPTWLVSARESSATGLRIWGNPPQPSPYGPILVIYERGLLEAFPALSADQLIYVERCVSLMAMVAVTFLLSGPRVAWWALHPLVLFEFAVATHVDVLMLLLLAVSLRSSNAILAGIALGASGMVKIIGLGAAAFRVAALPAALVTVGVFLALFPGAVTLAPLGIATAGYSGSPALVVLTLLRALHVPDAAAFAQGAVVGGGILLATTLRVQRRDIPVYATLILIMCATWVVPWYLTWLVFAARFAHRRTAVAAAVIAAASLILESKNQVGGRTELLATFVFLTVVVFTLLHAWSRGNPPIVRPFFRLGRAGSSVLK